MLIDRSHYRWALFSGVSFIAGTVSYIAYTWSGRNVPSGGTAMGLLYGVIGTAMMLFAGLLAARKPLRIRRMGSAQFWLKGHLWLGSLSVPFILFHTGFGWGGLLEQFLCYALVVVVSSGFFGLAMQQFLPRLLWNRTPLETFEGQTLYQCDRLTLIADLRVAGLCETPLNVPAGRLTEHGGRLVREYDAIVAGPGARNELNSKKLLLLQQVSPPDVRDFFWAMAKYAMSEAKVIRFEGDFPELLATTYAGLRRPSAKSQTPLTPPDSPTSVGALAPVRPMSTAGHLTVPVVIHSSVESTRPLMAANPTDELVPKASVATGVPRTISPLELMKKKAAESAIVNPPKLSPLDSMKLKANEIKNSAAEPLGATSPAPESASKLQSVVSLPADVVKPESTKVSPLDQLKTVGARTPAGSSDGALPTAGTAKPNGVRPSASAEVSVPPTAAERQLIQAFYTGQVRPFLAENRSRRSVLTSPMASDVETRRLFHEKEAMLPAQLHPLLNELQDCCEIRRQIELQRRILRWMNWWLMIHVPASVALLVLLMAHVVVALRVVPFTN